MAFRWQWLLILLVVSLAGERSVAASTREDRAYAAAASAFQDGMWNRAETGFAQFIQKYPKSDRLAEAGLMQAEAQFKQGKLAEAIALLTARKPLAGNLADEYVYWIGEVQFQNGDLMAAAETFASLARDFPESSYRLAAVVEAAAAQARTGEWVKVITLLEETNSVFQRAMQMDAANELVARGCLLLAQAKMAQNDYGAAAAVLTSLNPQTLKPDLDWQRAYLQFQIKLATGDTNAALATTTNLVQIAGKNDQLRAESVVLRAGVLEQLGQKFRAMAAYQEILALNAAGDRQRQAVLKIAELAIAENQLPDAEQSLEKFLARFPDSPSTDLALLTLGELQLKEYAAARPAGTATNLLQAAQANFGRFLVTFTNRNDPLVGKAYLDRGWCWWLAGNIADSKADFEAAAQSLPQSKDLAVARFKIGDVLFAQQDYTNAYENYRAVADDFGAYPAVVQGLGDRALYQMLRANLELRDVYGASNAMARILRLYPASALADNSILLVGEGLADSRQPAAARAIYRKFEDLIPNSPQQPQVELAIARTYEQEQDWPSAIAQYQDWRANFSTNALRPRADYALAQVYFRAGNETNAFSLYTNLVAQFPTNDLAPVAQYWVADYYFRLGGTNYVDAERNYQMLYQNTNWQELPLVYTNLAYQASMMAGRAAMGRLGYKDAIDHFKSLISDTNCPSKLVGPALFAYGGALMLLDSPDTNKPLANFQLATNVFGQICQLYPTNELGALAWNEIGDCNLQLGAFDAATNAYAQVFNSLFANISERSRAQIGVGLALEKKAAVPGAADQTSLLQQALDNYLDVLYKSDLRDGEQPDDFWTKKAGLQAAPLVEALGVADPEKFFERLEGLFPQLRDLLENKKATLLSARK